MKPYDFLLFDLDGTLMDFKRSEARAIAETLERYGLADDGQTARLYSQINDRCWKRFERGELSQRQVREERFVLLLEALGVKGNPEDMAEFYQERLGQQTIYTEGAQELIQELSGRYYLCVVTNGVAKTQYSRLKKDGFDHYFQNIFVSEEVGWPKPRKEFFDVCFRSIAGFSPDRALIIGDSLTSDIRGGNAAGIDTCWYNPTERLADMEVTITYEIRKLSELRQICP